MAAAGIEELLKKAQAHRVVVPPAEALRKAALLTRERGDLLGGGRAVRARRRRSRSGPGRAAAARAHRRRAGRALRERPGAARSGGGALRARVQDRSRRRPRHRGGAAALSRARRLAEGGAPVRGRAGDGVEPRAARARSWWSSGAPLAEQLRDLVAGGGAPRGGGAAAPARRDGQGAAGRRCISRPISPAPATSAAQLERAAQLFRRAGRCAARARRRRRRDGVPAARARRRSRITSTRRCGSSELTPKGKRTDELKPLLPRRAGAAPGAQAGRAVARRRRRRRGGGGAGRGGTTKATTPRSSPSALEELLAREKKWAKIAELRERLLRSLPRRAMRRPAGRRWPAHGSARPTPSATRRAAAALARRSGAPRGAQAARRAPDGAARLRDAGRRRPSGDRGGAARRSAAPAGRAGRHLREEAGRRGRGGRCLAARRGDRAVGEGRARELKRLQQKEDRWAVVTASLEKELETARDRDARAEVLAAPRAGPSRSPPPRSRAPAVRGRARASSRTTRRSTARWPIWPSARATGRRGETLKRQLRVSKEKVERLNLLRRLAVLYDERLDDRDELDVGVHRDPEHAARRSRRAQAPRAGLRARRRGRRGAADRRAREARAGGGHAGGEGAAPASAGGAATKSAATRRGAAERLERVLKLDKHDATAHEALARLYETARRVAPTRRWRSERALLKDDKRAAEWVEAVEALRPDRRRKSAATPARATKAWSEVLERRPSDREALEALSRLYARARRLGAARRRPGAAAEARRGRRRGRRWRSSARACSTSSSATRRRHCHPARVLDELAPRNLAAHELLRKLERETGDLDGSQRTAERELFLTEDRAPRWRWRSRSRALAARSKDLLRAIAAWRARDRAGARRDARRLTRRWRRWPSCTRASEPEKQLSPSTSSGWGWRWRPPTSRRRSRILFELAAHRRGAAPRRQARVRLLPSRARARRRQRRGTLNELRRVAEAHGLWEELCAVYARMPGLSRAARGGRDRRREAERSQARLRRGARRARPRSDRREAPARAGAAERARRRRARPARGLRAAARAPRSTAQKSTLLRKRADVREERHARRVGRARRDGARVRLIPDDAAILAELRRLAEATERWEDALAVEGFRFHRAPAEEQAGDRLRGGGARRGEGQGSAARLPRLPARVPAGAGRRDHSRPPVAAGAARRHHRRVEPRRRRWRAPRRRRRRPARRARWRRHRSPSRAREPTLEIDLDDVMFDESWPTVSAGRRARRAAPRSHGRAVDHGPGGDPRRSRRKPTAADDGAVALATSRW